MDGSTTRGLTNPEIEAPWEAGHAIAADNGHWRCIDCTTEPVTHDRPVMPVVARMLDLDEAGWQLHLAAKALDGRPFTAPEVFPETVRQLLDVGSALVAEVRRLRGEIDAGQPEWSRMAEAHYALVGERDGLRELVDGQTKTIGVLGTAVGKVAQLHTDDGDGWCKACQTIGYPCPTVLALGAGQ